MGKAIKLCNRVRQYFQDSRNLSVKIQHMVQNIAYFEYIITDSELEALVLEKQPDQRAQAKIQYHAEG